LDKNVANNMLLNAVPDMPKPNKDWKRNVISLHSSPDRSMYL